MVGDPAGGEVHPRARAALHLQLHHAKVKALGQKKVQICGRNIQLQSREKNSTLSKFICYEREKKNSKIMFYFSQFKC
jgi:hypothetical protein